MTPRLITSFGFTALLLTSMAAQASEPCGRVQIADMNVASATLLAHIDQFVLTHGFGCNVELVPGDTIPTGTSMMERGQPDIAPEIWTMSFGSTLDNALSEGRLTIASSPLIGGGVEGFWVPTYLVDEIPELATIEGIKANAHLFTHPENPSRSGIYGCPAGWVCQITARNNFIALDLEAYGFDLIDPGSAAALAGSIARAVERKQPWFGYYWSPTPLLGKYDMTMVDFGTGIDEEHYISCITQEACQDPKPSMWPTSPVHTLTTGEFAQRAPEAYIYLQNRALTGDDINAMLAWMDDNQADGSFAMEYFMLTHEAIWSEWISAEVAQQLRAELGL